MSQHIDSQFIINLQNLVKEVLTDEARYVSRNDQKMAVLHNKIFSKAEETPFASLQKMDRDFFNKYFYEGGNILTPKPKTPFATSPEDQAFFFDQLHQQVKNCTYNFDRMDYLRPSYTDDKATEPAFNADQSAILLRGLIFPLIFSVEQREISSLEQKKSGGAKPEADKDKNPYGQLADKILVQGQSGEFDVVMTYAQLEEIAAQEDQLKKQGLDQATVVKLLEEYIQKRFPGLGLKLTADGKVMTFLSAAGITAGGSFGGKDAVGGAKDLPTGIPGGMSFQELLKEMKMRQARKLQYDAIASSDGNLAFSPVNFQVDAGNGSKVQRNGMSVDIDQEGQGSVAVFFLTDHQGVTAKITVDTSAYRNGEPVDFRMSLYAKPEDDSPANPKLKLNQKDLPKLKTPFFVLYKQMQAPADYEVTKGKPLGAMPYKASDVKAPIYNGEETEEQPAEDDVETPLVGGALLAILPSGKVVLKDTTPKSPQGQPMPPKGFVMPKKPILAPPQPPKKKISAEVPVEEEGEEYPGGLIPQEGTKGKLPEEKVGVSGAQPKAKKSHMGLLVAASVGLPIAGALATAITNMMINVPPS